MQIIWEMLEYLNETVSIMINGHRKPTNTHIEGEAFKLLTPFFRTILFVCSYTFLCSSLYRHDTTPFPTMSRLRSHIASALHMAYSGHIYSHSNQVPDVKFLCMWNQSGNKFENNFKRTVHNIRMTCPVDLIWCMRRNLFGNKRKIEANHRLIWIKENIEIFS